MPITPAYLWGDALAVLDERVPAARIINLETSITTCSDWCRDKDIHYRMHPANIDCLTAAGIQIAATEETLPSSAGRVPPRHVTTPSGPSGVASASSHREATCWPAPPSPMRTVSRTQPGTPRSGD
jgi:poly-gamma-glutamate synthesis protein (capsule biosynthesis protein)